MKTEKVSAWKQSAFGLIEAVDILNALFHSIVSTGTLLGIMLGIDKVPTLEAFKIPTLAMLIFLAGVFLSSFFGDIIKRIRKKAKKLKIDIE